MSRLRGATLLITLMLGCCKAAPLQPNGIVPVRGVNLGRLGGWLVTEPWILPKLFETANIGVPLKADGSMQVVDEWTWHNASLVGTHNRTQMLMDHWATFVTQQHLVTLKNAGITHLRIPVGYWYFNYTSSEPFNNGASAFPLALAALKNLVNNWAAPLGLKVRPVVRGFSVVESVCAAGAAGLAHGTRLTEWVRQQRSARRHKPVESA